MEHLYYDFGFSASRGIIFGIIGDKLGRKKAILTAVVGLGISVFLTGFLPTYKEAGIWAPILLTIFRISTGIFAGGEYSNSAVIIIESVPQNKRGRWGGAIQSGYAIGFVLAAIVFLILHYAIPKESFMAYGWRWMFWITIVLTLIAVFVVKYRMIESVMWEKINKSGKTSKASLKELFKSKESTQGVITGMIFMVGMSWVYGLVPGFYPTVLSFSKYIVFPGTLYVVIIATFAVLAGYIISGFISDIIGRRKTIIFFSLVAIILSILLTHIIMSKSGFAITSIIAGILAFFTAGLYGVTPSFLSEKFSTEIRSTAVGTSFNSGFILGNWGTAILLAISKMSSGNFYITWGAFIIVGEALVLISALLSKETKNITLE